MCRSYLNGAVVLAGGVTAHVAGVAAARAALHLHAGRPYQKVGRRGIHLAPGDLVDHRSCLAQRRDCLLHWERDTGRVQSALGDTLSKCGGVLMYCCHLSYSPAAAALCILSWLIL